ncbi:MAG TPA: tetratricopeptide repeat protein [Chthonomonadaceae bacterium]|nr:tetratricopeptide repeat protein [Chthonomonadaceae bacterium]
MKHVIASTNQSSANPKRLRILLGMLVCTAVAWGITRPYIVALKRKPVAVSIPTASTLLTTGRERAEQGRWLEAVEILDAALRSGADTAETHRILGRSLGELGWVTDTIAEYEKAIQREPAFFNTYISLATAYRSIGRRAEALRTLQRAEATLRSSAPRETPARYARPAAPMLEALAEAYARLGEFPRSVQWATQAQNADPTRPQGYLLAAKSYFVLKQADRAIPLLQKACSYAPDDPDAHYTLALALRARPSEPHTLLAREHLLAALKLDPQHAPALYQFGLICMERKEWEAALRAFRSAYELRYEPGALLWRAGQASQAQGDKVQTAFFLGQYYEYIGQLDTALRYFQQLLASPQYSRSVYTFLARTQTKAGRYQAALAALAKAIQRDPRAPDLRRQQAEVYSKLHIVTKQIAALQEAARLDPQNAHRDTFLLGKIALEVGNYDEAEQLLEKSIALKPDESQYHYALGQTYLLRPEMGDRLNRAIRHLEEAERLAPDSVTLHDFLSAAYMKAGRWEEAAVALHRSANLAAQNQVLYFRLNQIYRRLGNEREAQRAQDYYQRLRKQEVESDLLSRRVKAHPGDPAAHLAMGSLLLRMRDYAAARREFEKALALSPDNLTAHEGMVTVYGELAQPEGQWQHLQQWKRLLASKRS